jgi:hypothetical protein
MGCEGTTREVVVINTGRRRGAQGVGGEPLCNVAVLSDGSRRLPRITQGKVLIEGPSSDRFGSRAADRAAKSWVILGSRLLPTYRAVKL